MELPRFHGPPDRCAEEVSRWQKQTSSSRAGVPAPDGVRVALVRAGRTPGELAREFECSAQAVRNRVRQADRDEGRREDGLTSAERDEPLAVSDFPAAHRTHLRTTNVIESAFATIRHRSSQAKGCVTRKTMLSIIYKMGMRGRAERQSHVEGRMDARAGD